MTTFTMQDLNQINDLPNTPEEDEAMEALAKLGGGVVLNLNREAQHSPTPQPTLCESTQTPSLTDIINNICTQLQLLTTVIGEQARGNSQTDNQSLQDCVSETLKQAGWFEDMVREAVNDMEFSDMIKDCVETEVEHYFAYSFDPTDHFDIDDAVTNAVDDKIDQAVEDYMDNATLSITRG